MKIVKFLVPAFAALTFAACAGKGATAVDQTGYPVITGYNRMFILL